MNSFSKKLFIIFINIIGIFIIFITVDIVFAYKIYLKEVSFSKQNIMKHKNYKDFIKKVDIDGKFIYRPRLITFKYVYNKHLKNFPPKYVPSTPASAGNKKKSILIFGDSFAEGFFLNQNQKLNYFLSELTGRPTYNFAISGTGPSQMLYETRLNSLYDIIDVIPEYAIYVYIPCHILRIFEANYGILDSYVHYDVKTLKNGEKILKEGNYIFSWFCRFRIVQNFLNNYVNKKIMIPENQDKNFDLLKLYFTESRKELQKRYPNIKFIIVKYPSYSYGAQHDSSNNIFISNRWKELEDLGFIVYDLNEKVNVNLKDDEYTLADQHPNGKAWEIVSKTIVSDLHL